MSEWLTSHWTEIVFGAIVIIIVRGDALRRLVKRGREEEKREKDAEVDRRLAPMRERAESAERLSSTLKVERDESLKNLQNCIEKNIELEDKVKGQNEQIVKLVALQPEVLRITGDLEEMSARLQALEEQRRLGRGGGKHRHDDTSR